jgi:hypothetical protein
MTTRSITPVRRAAACLVLAGAGLGVAGGGVAWATAPVACGTPAHPALYSTTHHAAVPAVTHDVTVIDTAFVPGQAAVPEESHLEVTYVDGEGTPEGEGWTSGETTTIVDTEAYTDYGWIRTVVDRAGIPGTPAVPAVTHGETVVDEAAWDETVVDSPAVPAVDEVFHLATIVDRAAWDEKVVDKAEVPAVKEVSHLVTVVDKAAWDEKVVDSPAKPAVKEVSHWVTVVDKKAWDETVVDENGYAYKQKQTGKIKYKDTPSWNGEDNEHGKDYGWVRVPELDKTHVVHHKAVTHEEKVIDTPASPAVPEVSHIVHHEAVTHQEKVIDTPASPAIPEVSHTVHHEAVTHQEKVIDTPASPAIPEVNHVVRHEAVTHTVTVVDAPEVPAVEAVEELSHVETGWTRDPEVSPEGYGWSLTGQNFFHEATTHLRHEWTRTVVDVPAVPEVPEVPEVSHVETVVDVAGIPAWDERVLVSDATPAGPTCPSTPTIGTAVLGETAPQGAVSSNPAAVPTALAHTGSNLTAPLGAGLAFVVVGGALVAAGRRNRA